MDHCQGRGEKTEKGCPEHDSGRWVIIHVLSQDEEKGREGDEKEMQEGSKASYGGESPLRGWDVLRCDHVMGPGDREGCDIDVFEVLREVDQV